MTLAHVEEKFGSINLLTLCNPNRLLFPVELVMAANQLIVGNAEEIQTLSNAGIAESSGRQARNILIATLMVTVRRMCSLTTL
jgi:hypothetical protein